MSLLFLHSAGHCQRSTDKLEPVLSGQPKLSLFQLVEGEAVARTHGNQSGVTTCDARLRFQQIFSGSVFNLCPISFGPAVSTTHHLAFEASWLADSSCGKQEHHNDRVKDCTYTLLHH